MLVREDRGDAGDGLVAGFGLTFSLVPFAIGDVRELNGALAHEHPGRLGMIVTTSRLALPSSWPQEPASRSSPPRPRKPDGPRARRS